MGGCWIFENIIFDSDGCGGVGVEVVEVCGVGDFGVEGVDGGIVVGVEKVCLEVVFLVCGGFMKFEDYVFLLFVKSVIV